MSATSTQRTRMLTVKEVAAELRVSTKTIRRWLDAGDLPFHRFGHGIRISEDALSAFIRNSRE